MVIEAEKEVGVLAFDVVTMRTCLDTRLFAEPFAQRVRHPCVMYDDEESVVEK
jgi:hypothetical protein